MDQADRVRIIELREREAAIREGLSQLLDTIETEAKKLGDAPDFQSLKMSSLQFASDVRSSTIDADLAEARRALAKYDGVNGYDRALQSLKVMESFLKQCERAVVYACRVCRGICRRRG